MGNPEVPEKFKAARAAAAKGRPEFAIPKWAAIGALILILIAALVIGGFLFWQQKKPKTSAAAAAIPEKTIPVLPFANINPEPHNAYFSHGLPGEILTPLSKIPGLNDI